MRSDTSFISHGREQHVEALLAAYLQTTTEGRHQGPKLVTLEASPGQGKTRVVQEFYERIAADQRFWPRSLVPDDGPGLSESSRRKHFSLPVNCPTGEGDMPFMFLGVECRRDSRGETTDDLLEARRFLELHLPSVFHQPTWSVDDFLSEFKNQSGDIAIAAAFEVLGLAFSSLVPVGGLAKLAFQRGSASVKRARLKSLEQSDRRVDVRLGIAEEFVMSVALASRRRKQLPIVIVVEDAHWASDGLCRALLALLNPANKAKPSVLVIASGWPELLDDPQNLWATTVSELTEQGVIVDRRRLEPFTIAAGAELVRQAYPETEETVTRAFSRHADGVPHLISLLLESRDVKASASGARLAMTPSDIADLPRGLTDTYQQLWREVDERVRDVLGVAALQSDEPVASVTEYLASLLLEPQDEGTTDVPDSLAAGVDPYQWLRRVESSVDLLRFYERERHDLAYDWNPRQFKTKAPALIADYVISVRSDSEAWKATPGDVRARLLRLHIGLCDEHPDLEQHQAALSEWALALEETSVRLRVDHVESAVERALHAFVQAPEKAFRLGIFIAPANRVLEVPLPVWMLLQSAPLLNLTNRPVLNRLSLAALEAMIGREESLPVLEAVLTAPGGVAPHLELEGITSAFGSSDRAVEFSKTVEPETLAEPEGRSAARRFLAKLVAVSDPARAEMLLRMDLEDAETTGLPRALTIITLVHVLALHGHAEEESFLEGLDFDEIDNPTTRSWCRQRFAKLLIGSAFDEALDVLRSDVDDPATDAQWRSLSRTLLAGYMTDQDPRGAANVFIEAIDDPATPDETKAFTKLNLAMWLSWVQPFEALALLEQAMDEGANYSAGLIIGDFYFELLSLLSPTTTERRLEELLADEAAASSDPPGRSVFRRRLADLKRSSRRVDDAKALLMLELEDPGVRVADRDRAALSLADVVEATDPPAAKELRELVAESPESSIHARSRARQSLAHALAGADPEAAGALLAVDLRDYEHRTMESPALTYRSLSRRHLAGYLSETDRSAAVGNLGADISDESTPALSRILSRHSLARLLADTDPDESLNQLDAALTDLESMPDRDVMETLEGLRRLGDTRAAVGLSEEILALSGLDGESRTFAHTVIALSNVLTNRKAAFDSILEGCSDDRTTARGRTWSRFLLAASLMDEDFERSVEVLAEICREDSEAPGYLADISSTTLAALWLQNENEPAEVRAARASEIVEPVIASNEAWPATRAVALAIAAEAAETSGHDQLQREILKQAVADESLPGYRRKLAQDELARLDSDRR